MGLSGALERCQGGLGGDGVANGIGAAEAVEVGGPPFEPVRELPVQLVPVKGGWDRLVAAKFGVKAL